MRILTWSGIFVVFDDFRGEQGLEMRFAVEGAFVGLISIHAGIEQ